MVLKLDNRLSAIILTIQWIHIHIEDSLHLNVLLQICRVTIAMILIYLCRGIGILIIILSKQNIYPRQSKNVAEIKECFINYVKEIFSF